MEKKYIDESINPGEDFFKYATGHWLDYNPQLPEYPKWGCFTALNEENIKRVEKIIKKPNGSEISQKINDYYNIVMNWDRRNEEGLKPMLTYLYKNIYSLFTREDIIKFCATDHCGLFFNIFNEIDFEDSNKYTVYISEGGLSLGNKEYYLSKDPDNKKIVNAWKKYVIALYKAYGKTDEVAKEKFKTIYGIERKIAKVSYSNEERYDPATIWHPTTVKKASKKFKFNFEEFLKIWQYDATTEINIENEKQLKLACKLYNELSVEELKTILEWQFMDAFSGCAGDEIAKIKFKFNKAITGAKKQMPKKKRAINATNALFGEAIGQVYVKKYFSEEAKEDVKNLVNDLVISYKNIITDQEWMSEETKKLALAKLNNFIVKVGYPDKVEDYSDIPINSSLSLFENKLAIGKYFFEKNKEKYYNKPVDKTEWYMNPQEVGAYYNQTSNEICFPAGILQPPFYEYGRSAEENYGAIGVVIGHEMTHGYDNHGRQFDIDGNLKMWWKEEEIEKFNNLCETTKEHFNDLEAIPGVKCNGGLTLSENLADYGGIRIAYDALMRSNVSIEESKAFFITYAQIWAFTTTDEAVKQQVLNNEHSVNNIRVNGTLPMFTPWYEAFGITEEDKLYVKPENRAKIW